jgi:predicted transcriptional regulator
MTETLSIRLDTDTKKRLDTLAKRTKRSKSFLAAEAVARYVEAEEWQLGEIEAGLADLDDARTVGHKKVVRWLGSWGKSAVKKPPQ